MRTLPAETNNCYRGTEDSTGVCEDFTGKTASEGLNKSKG